jgi:DNA (cytosine-5)-methyltransferase 1
MRHLDLFSGIGGFSLAAQWVWGEEHEIVSFVEIDKFCQQVLKKHWPDVPIHDDIKTLKGDSFGTVDLITGGFPCQPFSVAGKRRGKGDDRYLWPEMLRIIQEARPTWIIGENVIGFVDMGLGESLDDLERIGFETQAIIIPACAVGSPIRRYRVFILAVSSSSRLQKTFKRYGDFMGISSTPPNNFSGLAANKWSLSKRNRGEIRNGDGIPHWMDRIKSLGNAIVPQVVYLIMQAIKLIDEERSK